MKIRSLQSVISEASETFKRFPFGILCAFAGTVCMLMLVEANGADKNSTRILTQLLVTFSLGMVASVGTDLFNQRYYVRNKTQILFNFFILALMIVYYKTLPDEFTVKAGARTFLLALAAHLGVSFAPFLVNYEPTGFWQFNKTLFLRFLTALLYSTVLFVGIGLALLAIENLFKVPVPDKLYFKIWVVIAGIFNTWFFLAGIPRNIADLNNNKDYPRGLKIFTQYVLLPLITLYLVILYAYTIRIIIIQELPVGWVSYLVIGFSMAGILALLLVWPLRNDELHRWIKTYTRNFYFALFPLIVLLFVAIGKRITQYGITESRYFIIALAVWLLMVAFYFLINKHKRIKIIPISLFVFALLAGFGPWNAFSVSEHSQFNRLKKLFEKNGWITNGKVNPSEKKIAFDDVKEISSSLDYLTSTHGVESVQPLFKQNLKILCNKDSSRAHVDYSYCILESIGLKYVSRYYSNIDSKDESEAFSFNSHESQTLNLDGYDYLISYNFNNTYEYAGKNAYQHFLMGSDSIVAEVSASRKNFALMMPDSSRLELNLEEMINRLGAKEMQQYDLKQDELTLKQSNAHYRLQFIITSIGGKNFKGNKNNELNYLQGKFLIGKNKK